MTQGMRVRAAARVAWAGLGLIVGGGLGGCSHPERRPVPPARTIGPGATAQAGGPTAPATGVAPIAASQNYRSGIPYGQPTVPAGTTGVVQTGATQPAATTTTQQRNYTPQVMPQVPGTNPGTIGTPMRPGSGGTLRLQSAIQPAPPANTMSAVRDSGAPVPASFVSASSADVPTPPAAPAGRFGTADSPPGVVMPPLPSHDVPGTIATSFP